VSNDRSTGTPRNGLQTAQAVAALALAALTFGGAVFSAGSVFSRLHSNEAIVERNGGRISVIEEWRRDIDRRCAENEAYHKRVEELRLDRGKLIEELEKRIIELEKKVK
jgi:hypothetical protein